ncbi:MAG: hypothetical protein V8R40_14550 [Dysosmobacter sp.]
METLEILGKTEFAGRTKGAADAIWQDCCISPTPLSKDRIGKGRSSYIDFVRPGRIITL